MRLVFLAVLVAGVVAASGCSGDHDGPLSAEERRELEARVEMRLPQDVARWVCGFDTEAEATAYLYDLGVRVEYPSGFLGEYAAYYVALAACEDKAARWARTSLSDALAECDAQPDVHPCHEIHDRLNDIVLDNAD